MKIGKDIAIVSLLGILSAPVTLTSTARRSLELDQRGEEHRSSNSEDKSSFRIILDSVMESQNDKIWRPGVPTEPQG